MDLPGARGAQRRAIDQDANPAHESAPLPGAYLTDGCTLFLVTHALSDRSTGEPLLELEDCRTFEILLAPARAVAESSLRSVSPALPA